MLYYEIIMDKFRDEIAALSLYHEDVTYLSVHHLQIMEIVLNLYRQTTQQQNEISRLSEEIKVMKGQINDLC
jgi:cell division protein FtsB